MIGRLPNSSVNPVRSVNHVNKSPRVIANDMRKSQRLSTHFVWCGRILGVGLRIVTRSLAHRVRV